MRYARHIACMVGDKLIKILASVKEIIHLGEVASCQNITRSRIKILFECVG
jgi:hypothetical protein